MSGASVESLMICLVNEYTSGDVGVTSVSEDTREQVREEVSRRDTQVPFSHTRM